MEIVKKLLENQMLICREFALKYTCQLYYSYQSLNEQTVLKNIGSGVFFTNQNDYFLFSASHVINTKVASNMYIPYGSEMIEIRGEVVNTVVDSGKTREDDKLDFVIVKLHINTIEKVKKMFDFISENELELDHKISDNHDYFLFGFPNAWTDKISENNKIIGFKPNPLILQTNSKTGKFTQVPEYDVNSKIILNYYNRNYNSTNSSDRFSNLPDPNGMSGCGLWYMPMKENIIEGKKHIKLAGIATDFFFQDNALAVTAIDVITETLRLKFDPKIQKSKRIKVNIQDKAD
ncbi:hypothetical protein WNY78_02535 [Psychroserpens sp. AS72]|uniref:hypothetical protein n=1 Tax=Psychroserpens sp. AS72 TaxID=3135775 RepID=UPI003178B0C7